MAEEIDKCEKLVYLDFDGNTVGIEAAKRISESLSKHPEFKRAIWKNMFTGRTKEEIPPALVRTRVDADGKCFLGVLMKCFIILDSLGRWCYQRKSFFGRIRPE